MFAIFNAAVSLFDHTFLLSHIKMSLFLQVFIMGLGDIGVELAKRLRPFGAKIIATKRSWASHSQASRQSSGM